MPAASGKGNITVPELVENGRKKLEGTLDSLSPTSLLPQDIRLYPKLSKFWLVNAIYTPRDITGDKD
jgi:hypothetical protein